MIWFYVAALAISLGVLAYVVSEGRKRAKVMSALEETYKILAQMADQRGEKKERHVQVTKDEDYIRLHDCGRFHRPSEDCPGI